MSSSPSATVLWLIEVDAFPATAKRFADTLDARELPWLRWSDDQRRLILPPTSPVVFWGSLGAAYEQKVASQWSPGALGDVDRFYCSAYYPHLAEYLANADSVFTTVAELVRSPRSAVGPLGGPERIFIRPDSPLKPFSGRELATADVDLAALDHGFYYDDQRLPVVASTAKQVGREWRFVIADRRVITGCEYEASRRGVSVEVPSAALEVAAAVSELPWQAAPLYVLDVGEVNGRLRVLELNPFSGADLYDCDPNAVIDAVADIALGQPKG